MENIMNVIFVYPGNFADSENNVSSLYCGNPDTVEKMFLTNLETRSSEQFLKSYNLNVKAVASKPGSSSELGNSDYNLTDVFNQINKMGIKNVTAIILAPIWNNCPKRGNADDKSKEEIISTIEKRFPTFNRFLVLTSKDNPFYSELPKSVKQFPDPGSSIGNPLTTLSCILYFNGSQFFNNQNITSAKQIPEGTEIFI